MQLEQGCPCNWKAVHATNSCRTGCQNLRVSDLWQVLCWLALPVQLGAPGPVGPAAASVLLPVSTHLTTLPLLVRTMLLLLARSRPPPAEAPSGPADPDQAGGRPRALLPLRRAPTPPCCCSGCCWYCCVWGPAGPTCTMGVWGMPAAAPATSSRHSVGKWAKRQYCSAQERFSNFCQSQF